MSMPSSFSIPHTGRRGREASRSILLMKVKMGMIPHGADLEQLPGLGLHALGAVDDHDRGVSGHQVR